jgi:NADP-dependent 3-hydroxy acid dehydrogenase YdfG
VLRCDVADADAVEAAAGRAELELGPIDVWINCAMNTAQGRVLDLEARDVRRATDVTYLGSVFGIQSALRRMVPRDRGHVVQIGSVLGYRAAPTEAPYAAAKHALRAFCAATSAELRLHGSRVRITTLVPPAMNTPHFGWVRATTRGAPRPFPPAVQPEAVADQVAWAIAHPRRSRIVLDLPTVLAIPLGRTDFPVTGPVVGWILARGLQTRAARPQALDALHAPLDDDTDHGARGAFGHLARSRLPEARLLRQPVRSTLGALSAAAALVGLRTVARRR